jgi:3'(2'), 5'-bisphosphate nucleotidase
MSSYEKEREVAQEAARRAGLLCVAVRNEMLDSPEKMEKAGKEPVTIADYGAQAIVLRTIQKHFPQDTSLAEEWGDEFIALSTEEQRANVLRHVGQAAGQNCTLEEVRGWLDFGRGGSGERIWVVDPIDGTKGFLRGDQFAVAVALLVNGEPVVGALACPLLPVDPAQPDEERGVVATAIRGQGAVLEALSGVSERPMHVSAAQAATARAVESIEHSDHSFSADVFREAGLGGQLVRMDSQAKYLAVADGRAEVYLRQSRSEDYREKVWDHAAGVLIVEEAGGRVTDLSGKPLEFTHGATLAENQGILATNGTLHEELRAAIQAIAVS